MVSRCKYAQDAGVGKYDCSAPSNFKCPFKNYSTTPDNVVSIVKCDNVIGVDMSMPRPDPTEELHDVLYEFHSDPRPKPKSAKELREILDGFFKAFPEAETKLAVSIYKDSEEYIENEDDN